MDEDDMVKELRTLTDLPGPVGRETLVQHYMEEQFRKHTSVAYDRVGNLLAHFPGAGVKTVVAAHACEIGFMVKWSTEDGFLKIAPNYKTRSVDTRILPFHEVTILTDTYERVDGVITVDTGHVVNKEARDKVPALEDLLVDVGANSRADLEALHIAVGCPVIWKSPLREMGTRLKGKAMDDRLGLVVLLELAELLSERESERDILLASTIQEEIGVRGARALASQYAVDEAYILEIIPTSRSDRNLQLGSGPAVVYKDSSLHYDHGLILECKKTAEKYGIPVQPALLERGITDGLGFFTNAASKPLLLGCPTLFPHSPGETIDTRDLYQLKNLLQHLISNRQKE